MGLIFEDSCKPAETREGSLHVPLDYLVVVSLRSRCWGVAFLDVDQLEKLIRHKSLESSVVYTFNYEIGFEINLRNSVIR